MEVALRYETFSYERRVPEQSLLYRILAENLETFLDRARTEEHGLPRYVEKELREYLACGVLGHGFVRLRTHGRINCRNWGVETPGRQGAPTQDWQRQFKEKQRRRAGWPGVPKWQVILPWVLKLVFRHFRGGTEPAPPPLRGRLGGGASVLFI